MKDKFNTYYNKSYRFLSFDGLIETVESGFLRFSRPDTFNDPLDTSPFLLDFDWNEFDDIDPHVLTRVNNSVSQTALGSVYICSFSKTYFKPKSYLMWAHYGKSHTQVCFEVDFSKHTYLGGPSEVIYPNDIVKKRNKTKRDNGDLAMFLNTNKNKVWNYEKEVRLICDTRVTGTNSDVFTSDDRKHLFVKFDIELISKVIFGFKSASDDEAKIIALFKKKEYMPEFEKMVIVPSTLNLVPRRLVLK